MTIDKKKLQPLLWSVVGAWRAGDAELQRYTDALDSYLGEMTVEEVALELLAEIDQLATQVRAAGAQLQEVAHG